MPFLTFLTKGVKCDTFWQAGQEETRIGVSLMQWNAALSKVCPTGRRKETLRRVVSLSTLRRVFLPAPVGGEELLCAESPSLLLPAGIPSLYSHHADQPAV